MNALRNSRGMLGAILATAFLAGCASEYTGSRTVVGEQTALPELSDSSDTNTYFGILESRDYMTLSVKIEPCDMTPAACADGSCTDCEAK